MRAVFAVAAATYIAACGLSAPTAEAGVYGQQIELYAPTQHSVRVCGINQFEQAVCHVWNTLGYHHRHYYKLASWWWIGTVTIQNFADREAQHQLDITICKIPVMQRGNWTRCNGFGHPSSATELSNSLAVQLFAGGQSRLRKVESETPKGADELLAPAVIFGFALAVVAIGLTIYAPRRSRITLGVAFCLYLVAGGLVVLGLVVLGLALSISAGVTIAVGAVIVFGRRALTTTRMKSRRRPHPQRHS